jgi:predicted dinucleotide-binding enzyme
MTIKPQPAVLFYATDDDEAAVNTVEVPIQVAGFEPFKVGGVAAAVPIEMPGGDLHEFDLHGELVDLNHARAAIAARKVTT